MSWRRVLLLVAAGLGLAGIIGAAVTGPRAPDLAPFVARLDRFDFYHHGRWDMMYGFGAWMWLVWIGVILLVVWLVLQVTSPPTADRRRPARALEILEERYAKGEISRGDFLQAKEDLES